MTKHIEKLEEERDQLYEEVLKLRTNKMDAFVRHTAELEVVTADSKMSAAIAVLQAMVGLAKEDPVSWDVAGCKNAINHLMGLEPVEKKVEKADDGGHMKDVGATSGA